MTKRLRIAINAQIKPDDPSGGIATVVRALTALTELEGDEEFVFVGPYKDSEWLRPFIAPGHRVVRGPRPAWWRIDQREPFNRSLGPLRPMVRQFRQRVSFRKRAIGTGIPPLTTSANGNFFDSLDCDVVHFPFQAFEDSSVPSIFNPHDLQHLHYPEFFTPREIARRENLYPLACKAAHTVVVASQFVQRDVVERYGIDPAKVQVIPWAPPPWPKFLETTEKVSSDLAINYGLVDRPFALYPAMTWEHKNHLRLLEAVASISQNESLNLRIICTGAKTDFWPLIEQKLNDLGLNNVVKFTGLIPAPELAALYRSAQFVIVPTLFEAASAPIFEAWQHSAPVACAKVTSLPEQVKDAALLFEPTSIEEIATALLRMNTDSFLREDLTKRGTRRLREFSLERTAKAYRAVYRRAAGRSLNDEDRQLLDRDWSWSKEQKLEVSAG